MIMPFGDAKDPPSHRPATDASPALRVRPATAADAEGVAALSVQCSGGETEEHRQGFEREIAHADASNLVLVAEAGGEIIGFARARYFEPPADAPQHTAPAGWYLLGVNVLPSHRRSGVGAELTRARLDWIADRAVEAYYFTQEENHASIALHERFGFREVRRGVEFPRALQAASGRVLYRVEWSGRGGG